MTVYVAYRMDKYIVGSGYYMPLNMRVFDDQKKARAYVRQEGYGRDTKTKTYGMEFYSCLDPNRRSRFVIETLELV